MGAEEFANERIKMTFQIRHTHRDREREMKTKVKLYWQFMPNVGDGVLILLHHMMRVMVLVTILFYYNSKTDFSENIISARQTLCRMKMVNATCSSGKYWYIQMANKAHRPTHTHTIKATNCDRHRVILSKRSPLSMNGIWNELKSNLKILKWLPLYMLNFCTHIFIRHHIYKYNYVYFKVKSI